MSRLGFGAWKKIMFVTAFLAPFCYIALHPSLSFSFSSDAVHKYLQAYALYNSTSEELHYSLRETDSGYSFYPFAKYYHARFGDREIGAFPVYFSGLISTQMALFGKDWLVVAQAMVGLLLVLLLWHFWSLQSSLVLFLLYATPYFFYIVEFSENVYVILLGSVSLLVLERSLGKAKRNVYALLLSGAMLGMAVFLRMEAMIFGLCMALAGGYLWLRRGDARHLVAMVLFFCSFVTVVILFFGVNYALYGNVLGPRYVVNAEGMGRGLGVSLRHMYVMWVGDFSKIGLFGFVPLFGVFLFRGLVGRQERTFFQRWLVYSLLLFLIAVPILSPNDGRVNWGPRYLSLALLPLVYLGSRFYWPDEFKLDRRCILTAGLCMYSVFIAYLGFTIFHNADKLTEKASQEFYSVAGEIRLFQNRSISTAIGARSYTEKIAMVSDIRDLPGFIAVMKKNYPERTLAYYEYKPGLEEYEAAKKAQKSRPFQRFFDKVTFAEYAEEPAREGLLTQQAKNDYRLLLDQALRREGKEEKTFFTAYRYRIP